MNNNSNLNQEFKFLNEYWDTYKNLLFKNRNDSELISTKNLFKGINKKGGQIIFVGNGASASLSSHAVADLTKQGTLNQFLNDHNLITALSNDYGYENWIAKALSYYARSEDLLVLISVSGESPNLIKALEYAKSKY